MRAATRAHAHTHTHTRLFLHISMNWTDCFLINCRLDTCMNTVHLSLIIAASSVSPLHTQVTAGAQGPDRFSHTCALLLILPVFLSPHRRGAVANLQNASVFLKATSKRGLGCGRGNHIWNWTRVLERLQKEATKLC